MLWQEDVQNPISVSLTTVDVIFNIQCRTLPIDHAYALSQALQKALPWFNAEPVAGLHLIHGAESGNGWYRPEETDDIMYLSQRTKLMLRLPRHSITPAQLLTGLTLNVAGHPLKIGKLTVKPLSKTAVLFARYLLADSAQTEEAFLEQTIKQIQALGVQCHKALCGKTHQFKTPTTPLFTRSLMLAELSAPDSILLQEQGIGNGKKMGFGLFIPHKDIKPVNQDENK